MESFYLKMYTFISDGFKMHHNSPIKVNILRKPSASHPNSRKILPKPKTHCAMHFDSKYHDKEPSGKGVPHTSDTFHAQFFPLFNILTQIQYKPQIY